MAKTTGQSLNFHFCRNCAPASGERGQGNEINFFFHAQLFPSWAVLFFASRALALFLWPVNLMLVSWWVSLQRARARLMLLFILYCRRWYAIMILHFFAPASLFLANVPLPALSLSLWMNSILSLEYLSAFSLCVCVCIYFPKIKTRRKTTK